MLLRLVAVLALVMTSFGVGPAMVAAAQDSDEPASVLVEQPGTDDGGEADATADQASNLPALLTGAVLLGAGVWAYRNKKKRFPGARFRN